jgi:hypothetical protein
MAMLMNVSPDCTKATLNTLRELSNCGKEVCLILAKAGLATSLAGFLLIKTYKNI